MGNASHGILNLPAVVNETLIVARKIPIAKEQLAATKCGEPTP